MFEDFFIRALIGGILVAAVAAPFGVFVVWRRLAYFGDTLAHSALLGVALGYLLHVNLTFGVILVCLAVACLLFFFQRQKSLAGDTILGILSHSALSLGLVVLAFFETIRIDLMGYLFGDILAIGNTDLFWIAGCGTGALLLLALLWRPLLIVSLHEDLARVEGERVDLVKFAFVCVMAVLVAVMMKIVGLVLVTSLFIIPAAAARKFARTPEAMALLAALFGVFSVVAGLFGSYWWDTPAGPTIVLAAAIMFVAGFFLPCRNSG